MESEANVKVWILLALSGVLWTVLLMLVGALWGFMRSEIAGLKAQIKEIAIKQEVDHDKIIKLEQRDDRHDEAFDSMTVRIRDVDGKIDKINDKLDQIMLQQSGAGSGIFGRGGNKP
jgi:hypothetical protein